MMSSDKKFDAQELVEFYTRCVINQLNLLERRFFSEAMDPDIRKGVTDFQKAMIIINTRLEENNREKLPMFFVIYKEYSC